MRPLDPMQQDVESVIAALHQKYPLEPYVEQALDRKLRLRSGGSYAAQSLAAIQERLEAFLARRINGHFEVSEMRPLAGGISKEQFSFLLTRHDGPEPGERLVLRTQPPQSAAETHRLREYQLMGALQGTMPIPEPRWIDPEGDEFENPTLICSFVPGISNPAEGLTELLVGYGPYRERLAPQFVEMLARAHRFDLYEADLSSFLIPPTGSNAGVIQLIDWWARVWEEDNVEPDPLVTLAERWLRDNAPAIDHASITHGDYRSSNFLFSRESGDITAVLDWELAWIGDRHVDLAYALLPMYAEKDEAGHDLVCGLMTREVFLEEYERRSGLSVDPARLDYYEVLVSWRTAVTTIAGGGRCVVEQKTHQDVTFAWFVPLAGQSMMVSLREALEHRLIEAGATPRIMAGA
jgi:aminoglycoside phosphotransferase (APT) family kinase protein